MQKSINSQIAEARMSENPPHGPEGPPAPQPSKALGGLGTAIAVGLIILWLIGIVILWLRIDDDAHWAKMLVIFNSIEAVAFAAVGALLGVQVKRVEVAENAEKKAKADVVQEKNISSIGEDLAHNVLGERNHIFLNDETTAFHLNKMKTGTTRSVELAEQLLNARRAANRNV